MRPRRLASEHAQLPTGCALPATIEELPLQNEATNLLRLPEQNQTKEGQSAEVPAAGRFETAFFWDETFLKENTKLREEDGSTRVNTRGFKTHENAHVS
jgi:hypothetical protein